MPKIIPLNAHDFAIQIKAQIEIVRGCNLRCPGCPSHLNNKEIKIMDFNLYKRIVDECSSYLKQISLFNYGEPLLCQNIHEYIKYAKDRKIPNIYIHTNGTLLSSNVISNIIDSKLDRLTISVDGIDQRTYSVYRKGGSFNNVINNIKKMSLEKEKRRSPLPEIEAQFIVMPHNAHYTQQFIELCRELRVNTISFKKFNYRFNYRNSVHDKNNEKITSLSDRCYMDSDKSNCEWIRNVLCVNYDGTIVSCSYNFDGYRSFGKFGAGNKFNWWNYTQRNIFLEELKAAEKMNTLCQNCPGGKSNIIKMKL